MIRLIPSKPHLSMLDIATGTGEVLLEGFKQNKIEMGVGIDLAKEMLKLAETKFAQTPFRAQAQFTHASALKVPFDDQFFDVVTISYGIRNVQSVEQAFKEMYRVVKPGGKVIVLEFSLPQNKLLKKMHLLYLRKVLPQIGYLISKSKSAYEYLNQTIESFPYGESFLNYYKQAGFENTQAMPILGGITTLYCGEKPVET